MFYSIIIPYKDNNRNYIKDCIKSLEDQTYKDFEVLFLHNSSKELEKVLENTSISYKNIEVNENQQFSKNYGVSKANGQYILFMDSDDYLHPNALIYAKQIIDEDFENTNAVKLGIKKTHFDKRTTFKSNEQAFYKEDTFEKLETILENLNTNEVSENDLINQMFEKNMINHNYITVKRKKYIEKLNYHFKAHSLIIKKDFLIDNNIVFDNTNRLYGDIPFVVRLYSLLDNIKQTKVKLYFKLIHNDSINYPSITQEQNENRLYFKLLAYDRCLNVSENMTLSRQIKQIASKVYLYQICKSKDFKESFENIYPIYQILKDLLSKPSKSIKLKNRHWMEIQAIKKGNFEKAYKISKKRVQLYQYYDFIKLKNHRYRQKTVQQNVFSKMPMLKKTIVYESFLGRNYSDSPKAIFEYLMHNERYSDWNHIWILNDKTIIEDDNLFKEKNVKVINRFSWSYFFYVTVAKYFILNMRQPKWLEKKEEQIILSTWHGTPLKRLVFDMNNVTSANKNYKRDFYYQSRNWDYLIAANEYSEHIFERAFMYPKSNILTYGYPRNDILSTYNNQYKNILKEKLNIPLDKKVILYAPTWRDDEYHAAGQYKFKLQLDLEKMQNILGDDYVIVLRMHYFISDKIDLSCFKGFAFDFSKYNDINDLYIISDLLITDYSSVFFDYANLKKPILFYTYDLNKYKDELRGFYIDMVNDLPGPLLYNTDEVIQNIENIENVKKYYESKYKEFYQNFCNLDDGNATKRVVEKVIR
ncbi:MULTISPECIES: bifunctional glycosyltransferase/CDP-glycerol:glycerophosphate glycerophosphotransferase [Staphylococcus]|uniref:bifunctional glycosyltransferase/CDP-glycerol:glycerophosphate glycerophosphotransferase n=1 Tax=Staphylococcus TaxID=1279 RepID=UPI001866DB1F|nr:MULTISPECIES: CDP-glycerol:glycerophosphate glycerophosphotransferase [Staphylococcus]